MASAREEDRHSSHRLILDSGAVIAPARVDRRALAFPALSLELRSPTAHEIHGRTASRLLAAARSVHTVDALVVAQVLEGEEAHILTGDPGDLERLAAQHPNYLSIPSNWLSSLSTVARPRCASI